MTTPSITDLAADRFIGVRLVATDIDDTLLRSDLTITPRTASLIQQTQAMGIAFVLATARPPHSLLLIARQVGAQGFAIALNGALLFDLAQERIVQHFPIPAAIAQQVIVTLRTALPGICFGCQAGLRFGCEPGYAVLRPIAHQQGPWRADALTLAQEPLSKLMALHPTLPGEEVWQLATTLVGNLVTCTYSGLPLVEMSAAGVDKRSGLAALCQMLGIPAHAVIACGDMPNDLAMLRWAGLGVAVANAHPLVLEAADAITAHHDADGVALVLERVLQGA